MPLNDSSRAEWHYLPATMWPRAGVSLGELSEEQKNLLFQALEDYLSETGYAKTQQIIELENVLAKASGNSKFRDAEKYYAAFYGNPAADGLWGWSFEGHHLSLNFTVAEDVISMAPRFMGASPATIQTGPRKGMRALEKEQDLGLELINSMNNAQQNKAIFQKEAYREIITTNESKLKPLEVVGIPFQSLEDVQQKLLLQLIHEYLATMPAELARQRLEQLQCEELGEIRFGWAGATEAGKGHYYRIQGNSFLIEYDNTQNRANHIHCVWRDFDGDFGRDLIKEHYKHGHPHP